MLPEPKLRALVAAWRMSSEPRRIAGRKGVNLWRQLALFRSALTGPAARPPTAELAANDCTARARRGPPKDER